MSVTFQGKPIQLKGKLLAQGDALPAFTLVKGDLSAVQPADFRGKTLILLTVPSLDTGVCAAETKRFNQEAAKIPQVQVLVVSRDLPFAQSRFCQAEGVDKVITLSDVRDSGLAERLGVSIADGVLQGLMARVAFVVGADGKVKYVQVVPEITQEPDYAAIVAAAQ